MSFEKIFKKYYFSKIPMIAKRSFLRKNTCQYSEFSLE